MRNLLLCTLLAVAALLAAAPQPATAQFGGEWCTARMQLGLRPSPPPQRLPSALLWSGSAPHATVLCRPARPLLAGALLGAPAVCAQH